MHDPRKMDKFVFLPFVLVCSMMNCLAISGTDAKVILIKPNICAVRGREAILECVWDGPTTGTELTFYRETTERVFRPIGPFVDPTKYDVVRNFTVNATTGDGTSYRRKTVELKINNVSPGDGGIYGCGTERPDIRTTNVTIRDAELELYETRTNLSLTITPTAGCELEGIIRVAKIDSNGSRKDIPYGDGQGQGPYIGKDGSLIFPRLTCEDEGVYEFTYITRQGVHPVETKKTVRVQVENCKNMNTTSGYKDVNETGDNKKVETSEIANRTSNEDQETPQTDPESSAAVFKDLFIIAVVIIVVLVIIIVILVRKKIYRPIQGETGP